MEKTSYIDSCLEKVYSIVKSAPIDNPGLFTGIGSQVLFIAYYKLYSKKRLNKLLLEKVELLFSCLGQQQYVSAGFTNGFTGIIWLINHLKDHRFGIRKYLDFDFSFFEDKIIEEVYAELARKEDDPMGGYMGKLPYLSSGQNSFAKSEATQSIINELDRISLKEKDGSIWWNVGINSKDREDHFIDIGTAHGVCGILLRLISTLRGSSTHPLKMLELIHGGIKWIRSVEIAGGQYPSFFIDNKPKGLNRIAWCYGDLCVAEVFYQYGTVFNKPEYVEYAYLIICRVLLLDDIDTDIIQDKKNVDFCFCHGSAGLSYLYSMYAARFPDNIEIRKYSKRWLQKTLNQIDINVADDNIFGLNPEAFKLIPIENLRIGLLNGYTGVGLSIISTFATNQNVLLPNWGEALLIAP